MSWERMDNADEMNIGSLMPRENVCAKVVPTNEVIKYVKAVIKLA